MSDLSKFACVTGLCIIVVFGLLGIRGERLKRARTVALLDRAVGLLLGMPLVGVGVIFYTLSNNTIAQGQWPWPVVAALIALAGSLLVPPLLDNRRRLQEIDDLKASLYVEVVEFVTRSLHDYLTYWRDFKVHNADSLTASRIHDFRPTRPIIFPGIAGRLGLLADARHKSPVVPAVAKFYVRHDAVSQAVESTLFICEQREKTPNRVFDQKADRKRVDFIAERLQSCFSPAADALEGLEGPDSLDLDAATVRVYKALDEQLKKNGLKLREALRKYQEPIGEK